MDEEEVIEMISLLFSTDRERTVKCKTYSIVDRLGAGLVNLKVPTDSLLSRD